VRAKATVDAIAGAIEARLAEAPAFFRGSDVRVRVEDGKLAPGCLARIDEIAAKFELSIVEVGACKAPAVDAVPVVEATRGSEPTAESSMTISEAVAALVTETETETEAVTEAEAVAETVAETVAEAETVAAADPFPVPNPIPIPVPDPDPDPEPDVRGARTIVGPIRSGVILEHDGHVVVFGDVNPGAEVRASGNIVVLGRLRGTAHAGIGRDAGFILSLRLEPQQLRIGRQLARAGDSDTPGIHPEIAHVAGGNIIVERYLGRLPAGLGASI